jgi:hypothetical protein
MDYAVLFDELEKITLPLVRRESNYNRLGFSEHRRATFGIVRERFSGKINPSLHSRKYPKLYDLLIRHGAKICKHDFTSIHVVQNLTCPRHKDKSNVGISTLVSFGRYSGCRLVIEGEECDAYETPVEFNGFEKEHWNTDDLVGTKYSVIYFNIDLKDSCEPLFKYSDVSYKISIPSYKRSVLCNAQTLATLRDNNIAKECIDVFVVESEYDAYKHALNPENYNRLIVGKEGLVHQRNFINRYYPEGTNLVCLDDDIRQIDLQYTEYASLDEFFKKAFAQCIAEHVYLFSVNPVYNPFWREKKLALKRTNLNFCIGAFSGMRVSHDADLELKLCIEGGKEDVERSILHYLKYGRTLVFNRVGFKTKYFGTDGGGLGGMTSRISICNEQAMRLCEKYPELCKSKVRKNGMCEVVFKKL